ncbi:histidine kinase [Tenacibaculum discolor]|uniref:sensor histidine kinase n=1 Tax=Tenacibaculum discolor TaxID=361581 RepID=UPI003F7A0C12
MKKTFYILIFISFLFENVFSQEPFYTQFTSDDGLVSLANYNIIQDKNNLVWVGGEQGLFYYNGKRFRQVKNTISTTKSIFNLQIDKEGQIWCSTISGHIYKVVNKELQLFKDFSNDLKGTYAHLIVMKNNIFFLSQKKSYLIAKKTGFVKKDLNAEISKIAKSENGFFYYNLKERNIITHVYENEDEPVFRKVKCNKEKFFLDNGNFQMFQWFDEIVIKLDKDVLKPFSINIHTRKITTTKLPQTLEKAQIYNTKKFKENWLLTSKGIYRTLNKNKVNNTKQIFKDYHITDVLKDYENNYWLTTLQNGIFVVPSLEITKKSFLEIKEDIISIETIGNSRLLLGTQNGNLIDYNTKGNDYKIISLSNQRPVNRIKYNKNLQKAYISTNGTSSYTYDIKKLKITNAGNQFTTAKGFTKINKDSLVYLSYRRAIIYTQLSRNKNYIVLENKRPISTHYDSKNKLIYVTYIDGTVAYNSKLQTIPVHHQNKPIIFSEYTQTTNGKIWATTRDKILALEAGKVTDSITCLNGLLQSQIKGILGKDNFLWIVTEKGIQRYDTDKKIINTINLTDKSAIKFKTPVIQNNYLWIPGNNFLCRINTSVPELIEPKLAPLAYISNVKIGGIEQEIKTKYKLPYKTNDITFNFNANGFKSSSKNVFQYKLLGFNTEWQTSELNDDVVRYIGIPSGKYKFLLRTKSLDGSIGKESKGVKIIVQKPFWESWWFIVTIFIISVLGIIIYYRIKLKWKEEEGERELERVILDSRISKLRLENLRSQMNPHFIFNSLGAIQDYVMKNEKYLASDYLVKFSRLIRMYLNHSRVNVILLKEELSSLEIYISLEQLRFENKFKVHFLVDKNINKDQIEVPPLFIQPFVENAIKHGLVHKKDQGNLWITVEENINKILIITIKDDGVGRKKSSEINKKRKGHKSFAVNATQERVSLYKKEKLFDISVDFTDKVDENNNATGTIVTLKIKRI